MLLINILNSDGKWECTLTERVYIKN